MFLESVSNLLLLVQNFPLYLRSVNPQNEADLHFQYLVHASIDVVEEKGSPFPLKNELTRLL